MKRSRLRTRCLAACLALPALGVQAQQQPAASSPQPAPQTEETPAPDGATPAADDSMLTRQERSPWLLVPLLSSGPKLGTSLGGMVGYIFRLDQQSAPSLLGIQAKRSDTGSEVVGAGGKLYFNANRDRVGIGLVGGKVSNDYQDFLGSGQEVRSDETMRALFLRYQHSFWPNWYVGAQAVRSNYGVDGVDPVSDLILDEAGLVGVDAAGLGLIVTYDSRDNMHNPSDGTLAQLYNVAYRDSLGGDVSYDVYNADWRWYLRTGSNNVVAFHAAARWTEDAPASREATVQLRGYTRGQYLGKNSLSFEAENRYSFNTHWGAKAFAGVACLYGDGRSCGGDQLYPMVGVGGYYVLKPKENMLISVDYAKGSGDNHGLYIRFGHSF